MKPVKSCYSDFILITNHNDMRIHWDYLILKNGISSFILPTSLTKICIFFLFIYKYLYMNRKLRGLGTMVNARYALPNEDYICMYEQGEYLWGHCLNGMDTILQFLLIDSEIVLWGVIRHEMQYRISVAELATDICEDCAFKRTIYVFTRAI